MFAFRVVRRILLPSQKRLEQELKKTPKLRKFWNLIKKNDEKMDEEARMQYVTTDFFPVKSNIRCIDCCNSTK